MHDPLKCDMNNYCIIIFLDEFPYIEMPYLQNFRFSMFISYLILYMHSFHIISFHLMFPYSDYFMRKLCTLINSQLNLFLIFHVVLLRLGSEDLLKAGNGSITLILLEPWCDNGFIFSDDADATTDARLIRAARAFNFT